MYNEDFVVVCFRGTESLRDWMTNLNFVQIAAPHFPQRYLKNGVRVHTGFNEALSVRVVWAKWKVSNGRDSLFGLKSQSSLGELIDLSLICDFSFAGILWEELWPTCVSATLH